MRYFEPFAGGAAMFFALRPRRAALGDINDSLCNMYEAVRDDVESVIAELEALAAVHSKARFYVVRSAYNERASVARHCHAAMFLYLNRTCFNGLHRLNMRGQFNTPAGDINQPWHVEADALRRASHALRDAELHTQRFDALLDRAASGDFAYLDPPYEPRAANSFTRYNGFAFGPAEQNALRDVVEELDRRGCKFMLSNSDTPANRLRYANFEVRTVWAARAVNCKGDGRGAISELVVRNYL
jgi:DNA adenine methylase